MTDHYHLYMRTEARRRSYTEEVASHNQMMSDEDNEVASNSDVWERRPCLMHRTTLKIGF